MMIRYDALSKRRLDRWPYLLGRADRWKKVHSRHSTSDLLAVELALHAVLHVALDLLRSTFRQLAVEIRREPPRHVPREHRHPREPATPLSRSASILCPRLSLEATVPIEQCRALAICS